MVMMVAFSALLLSPHRSPPALLRIRRAPLPVCREWEPGQGFGPLAEQLDAWVDPDDTDDEEVGFSSEEMDQRRDKMLEKWADFVQLGGVKAQKAPSLVELRDVTVRYGGRDVLCNATWAVREGQVVGVLGESGCGKTTQLRLLAGELEPHAGAIERRPGLRVGHVPQGAEALLKGSQQTVREFARALGGEAEVAEREARALGALAGASQPSDEALLEQRVGALSNGQRTRLAALAALEAAPELLLLDEPTNHLDLAGLEWLEQEVRRATQERAVAAVVVSHDREFLDRVTTHTLDASAGEPRLYLGGYTTYVERRRQRDEALEQQTAEARAAGRDASPEARLAPSRFRIGGGAATKARKGKGGGGGGDGGGDDVLLSLEGVEVRLRGDGAGGEPAGGEAGGEGEPAPGAGGRGEAERSVLCGVDLSLRRGQRLLLLGDNGAGKSTLLRAALGALPLAAGTVTLAESVSRFYFAQDAPEQLQGLPHEAEGGSVLEAALAAAPHAEPERVMRALKQMGLPKEVHGAPARALSGGERARFCLAQMLVSKAELLLLDEPTNHLDVAAREAVEEALRSFEGTLLLVSHDRYFAAQVTSQVAVLRDGQLELQPGDYRDYVRATPPLLERLSSRVVPGASPPLLGGDKPRLRMPGGKVLVDGKQMDAKQAKSRKRKWRAEKKRE